MKEVSFVVIAYNEEKNIIHTLTSILGQKGLSDYELIVVNDGSTDNTARLVSAFANKHTHVTLIDNAINRGRGFARHEGVQKATGKYIAFVDADIILPPNWLTACMRYMDRYDAVGGMAVPDGDVTYIYVTFDLLPKKASQSTTITGNNGLYNRKIFYSVGFDPHSRDGEDFAFNCELKKRGFKLFSIPSLVVDHRESKSFWSSMRWLFQSGMGASRLFKQFGKVRLPDITFFGLLVTLIVSILVAYIFHVPFLLLLIPFYVVLTSSLHVYTKFLFQPSNIISIAAAILVNSLFLSAYYLGRIIGLFTTKNSNQSK